MNSLIFVASILTAGFAIWLISIEGIAKQPETKENIREKKEEMGETNTLVLHGMWASPFVKRVELAFRIKGVAFEYVEEDLMNKGPLLLKYNPVYKKVPVLVHNGNPIVESLVILEYIDEVWNNVGPHLLPRDPYRRAQLRFWADYVQKQIFEFQVPILMTQGEAQEKAVQVLKEKLKVFEDGVKELFTEGSKFVNGDEIGYLDIVVYSVLGSFKIQEEFLGLKYIEEDKIPVIFSWLTNLIEHPIGKEIFPSKDKILGLLTYVRQNALNKASAV